MSPGAPLEPPVVPSSLILYSYGGEAFISDRRYCHDKFIFIAVFSGEVVFEIDDREFRLHENEALLIAPYTKHCRIFWTRNYHALYASFRLPKEDGRIQLLAGRILPLKRAEWRLLKSATGEYLKWYRGCAGSATKSVLRMTEFLNSLLVRFQPSPAIADHRNYEMDFDEKLKKILQYIHEHLDRPISISKIASVLRISRGTVRASFSKQMKCSIGSYIRSRRLLTASNYLRGSDLTLSEIAALTGYNSGMSLSRALKRDLGKTPLQIRRDRRSPILPDPAAGS